jgi:hypothetical protein
MFHIKKLKLILLLVIGCQNVVSQDTIMFKLLNSSNCLYQRKDDTIYYQDDTLKHYCFKNKKGDEIHMLYSNKKRQNSFIMYKSYKNKMFAFIGSVKGSTYFISNSYLISDNELTIINNKRDISLFFTLDWFYLDKIFYKKHMKILFESVGST